SAKLKIKTPYASKTAVEKVKEAGGEVSGLVGVKE
ncbi:mitochondrial large ribosomal subunit protein uL15m, partial [Candidatus Woesearchaeota archaeon]|nr:mitochondrial large ribosomal subunit protein uL15m [Candidatus Woesearchaeota archaeon]